MNKHLQKLKALDKFGNNVKDQSGIPAYNMHSIYKIKKSEIFDSE